MWSGLGSEHAPSSHEHAESPDQSYSPAPNPRLMRCPAGRCCSRTPERQPPGPSPADTTSTGSMTRSSQDRRTVPSRRPTPRGETSGHGLGRFSVHLRLSGTSLCLQTASQRPKERPTLEHRSHGPEGEFCRSELLGRLLSASTRGSVPGDFGGVSTSEHTGYGAVRTDRPKSTSADDRIGGCRGRLFIRRLPRAAPQRGQSFQLCPQPPVRRLERV